MPALHHHRRHHHHHLLFMPDMSEKKSPPQKEKPVVVGTPQAEGRGAIKRKLLTPDPVDDEADKKAVTASKRKRPLGGFDASSPDHGGNSSSPRGGSGNVRSHGVPLSERQQMALLMRMTDETSQGDSSPKPSSPPPSVTTKRTPADKKVNKRNDRGETPLHIAAKRGDLKQARKLIKAGASVNVADYAGWTPLHEACNVGNIDVAKQLLKAGANVNVLGLGDESPLHDAASNSHRKLVSILLRHGANPQQQNDKGQTPVDVASDVNIRKLLNREIVSSNSETSSVDEVRSPTSPESLASIKDEDRGLDVEDIKPRSSSMSMVKGDNLYTAGSIGNRRMSLPPKSPVDKPLPSPRLFLKFKSAGGSSGEEVGSNHGQSNRKSTDSKEPYFKSYILTMDTGDQQQQHHQQQHQLQPPPPSSHHHHHHAAAAAHQQQQRGLNRGGSGRPSPACSPVSSMEVEEGGGVRRVDHHHLPGAYADHHHHHNQHHKARGGGGADSWDSIMRVGGGGGQNNVAALPSAPPPAPSSSSSSSLTVPSLKVQCVRPDSSEEESGGGIGGFPLSSQGSTTLQRLRTEPFTPQPLEEVSDDEEEERGGGGGVFRTTPTSVPRTSRLPNNTGASAASHRLSPSVIGSGGNSGSHQHIPASMDGVNHSVSSTGRHRVIHQTQGAALLDGGTPVVCVSRTSGVTSTTGSTVASAVEKDTLIASGPADRTSLPIINHPHGSRRSSGSSGVGGGGGSGSGSITCVNSSGMSGVGEGSVPPVTVGGGGVSHTNVSTSFPSSASLPSTSQPLRWDAAARSRTERGDRASPKPFPSLDFLSAEKSDSSASSPLRMDIDENISSSPRSDRDNECRPSCLKVPPLKIILPSQKASAAPHAPDQTKHLLSKPALPYVLNPTQAANAGQWTMDVTDSDEGTNPPVLVGAPVQEENSLTMNTSSPAPPSRPSSRTGSNERGEENKNSSSSFGKVALESSSALVPKEELTSNGKEEEEDGERLEEEEEREEESRPTRTLRSHTAMKQQQEQKHQKTGGPVKVEAAGKEGQEKGGSRADPKEFLENKEDGEPTSDTGTAPQDEIPVHPRKRKLRAKTEAQTREQAENREIVLEKPPNPYELYLNLRRQQIQNRHKLMNSVTPKPPTGFKDYLMVNCTYVLQGNATSTLSVPMLTPPNSVTGPMRELFEAQERARYRLRLQHHIEREKLMLAIEQEILREHARAARAVANQNQPLSVCTILCEEEIYNLQELDQVDERDKSSRSRYNGRQFLSWLQDVGDKYNNIKNLLLLRHHHEAESLHAVQKMDWEWKLKECGQCDYKTTPVIDELHLPMVQVNDEFELLPPQQRLRMS